VTPLLKFYCLSCEGFLSFEDVQEAGGEVFHLEAPEASPRFAPLRAVKKSEAKAGQDEPCGRCPECSGPVFCAVFDP
jgi:hypothetical protein